MFRLPFCNFVIYCFIFVVTTAQVLNYGARNIAPGINGAELQNHALHTAAPIANQFSTAALANNINTKVNAENVAINTLAAMNTANIANEMTSANLAALAAANFASAGNIAMFNLNTDGFPFTLISGSPGSPGFGFQVFADALEVGGKVNVNGEIPIYGTVSVNGNVPTDGSATVNYNCGKPLEV